MKTLDWEQARECGKAYGRVLDGFPKYDRDFEKKQREYNIKRAELKMLDSKINELADKPLRKIERYKKDPRGMWWLNKLADMVDRRVKITVPAYSPRAKKPEKKPEPKETP